MAHTRAPHPLPRYGARTPPRAWRVWVEKVLGASPRLSQLLWHRFRWSATYQELECIYSFSQHHDQAGAVALLRLISPQRLLTLCAEVAPEGTAPRRRDVQRLENVIVARALGPQCWQ